VSKSVLKIVNANKKLLLVKEAAESASQAKSDFISCLSHELYTPLNAIVGFSELLRDNDSILLDDESHENIDIILKNARALHSLIKEMIEFSKVNQENIEMSLSYCDLKDLLYKCIKIFEKQTLRKNIQINLNISSEFEESKIFVDERKLKKIIFYLLSNAIMFSFEDGIISIEAQKLKNEIVIKVCDAGIGIDPEYQQKIFLPFFQVQGGLVNKTPGVGLGLSISKSLVESHNGKIWVESEGKNKGTKLCFSLPQKK